MPETEYDPFGHFADQQRENTEKTNMADEFIKVYNDLLPVNKSREEGLEFMRNIIRPIIRQIISRAPEDVINGLTEEVVWFNFDKLTSKQMRTVIDDLKKISQ